MHDPLKDTQRLIQRTHLNDGLPELLIGFELFFLGTAYWMKSSLPDTWPMRIVDCVLALAFVALCLGSASVIKWVRIRLLMERTGFVQMKRDRNKLRRFFLAFAACAVAIAIVGSVTHGLRRDHWILVVLGILFGTAQIFLAWMPRFFVNGILTLATGIVLGLSAVSIEFGLALFFSFVGLLSMISGLIVFARFLHKPLKAA